MAHQASSVPVDEALPRVIFTAVALPAYVLSAPLLASDLRAIRVSDWRAKGPLMGSLLPPTLVSTNNELDR